MEVQARVSRLGPEQRELLARRLRSVVGGPMAEHDGDAAAGALVAHVQFREGAAMPNVDDLRQHVSRHLPAHMVPSVFVPADTLPLLPNGKVDRHALAMRRPSSGTAPPGAEAASAVEAQLMRIWDDLIGIREIGRDDNFFELGGHSLLLPRLVDRVRQDFGVTLPIGTIFQSPTVKGLAEIVQAGRLRAWRSLVGIRDRGRRPPLYLVHGLGGEIGYFYNLAEYLDPEQPVYGLQAPPEPFDQIDAMAAHYVKEIRTHQPHGPYLVGGYCVGGCVAYEMARQLVASGEPVHLVALIDSVMPGPRPLARRLKRFVSRSPREMRAVLGLRARALVGRLANRRSDAAARVMTLYGVPQAFQAVARRHFHAQLTYAPGPYPGDLWLFRSADNAFDPDLGWGPLVRGRLEVRNIPGTHADVLREPHLRETARQLSAVVDATIARHS